MATKPTGGDRDESQGEGVPDNPTGGPAYHMAGEKLSTGWTVLEMVSHEESGTGGNFSVGYFVEEEAKRRRGYLKALDFSGAFDSADPAKTLQDMTSAYVFERDLLEKCKGARMRRVATSICHGTHVPANFKPGMGTVCYLIFDLADGDIRKHKDMLQQFDLAWCLRSMHHAATGLMELHARGIAHQDLKPSNVLMFKNFGAKVADLGCSTDVAVSSINDIYPIAGDLTYAAPELFYSDVVSSGFEARKGADIYSLGGLLVFHFCHLSPTQWSLARIRAHNYPITRIFGQDIAWFRSEFDELLGWLQPRIDGIAKKLSGDIIQVIRELCEPDPGMRGSRRDRVSIHGSPFNLERYVAKFDLLAKKAELGAI